jgi:hypothetical protein
MRRTGSYNERHLAQHTDLANAKKGAAVSIDVKETTGVQTEEIAGDSGEAIAQASADTAAPESVAQVTADGMTRYYHLAKRQYWDARILKWGEQMPVPEGIGSAEKKARRHSMWRSVVTQQLQADMIAVEASTQLLVTAPDHEAKLYYTTMVNDESKHCEVWLKLSKEIGGVSEPDPFLEQLGKLTMNAETLEAMIWLFQCAFEGLVIPRFHQIARATPGTILSDICTRIAIDDGIHHGSGVCYERLLLERAPKSARRDVARITKEMWPLFVQHLTWRPRERAWANIAMRSRDFDFVSSQRDEIVKMGQDFGFDFQDLTV